MVSRKRVENSKDSGGIPSKAFHRPHQTTDEIKVSGNYIRLMRKNRKSSAFRLLVFRISDHNISNRRCVQDDNTEFSEWCAFWFISPYSVVKCENLSRPCHASLVKMAENTGNRQRTCRTTARYIGYPTIMNKLKEEQRWKSNLNSGNHDSRIRNIKHYYTITSEMTWPKNQSATSLYCSY